MNYYFAMIDLGSIPDWSMVIVTAITAFYLYQTLKSQKEVQRTQTELFRIESIRFKESIKPVLKFSASDDKFRPGKDDKKILTIELTNETESTALDISKNLFKDQESSQIFIPIGYADIRKHLTKGDQPLLYHFLIDPKIGHVSFVMKYKDIAGTKYSQRVYCICDEHGIEIHPSLPEME